MTWWEIPLGLLLFGALVVWIVTLTERAMVDEAKWPTAEGYEDEPADYDRH